MTADIPSLEKMLERVRRIQDILSGQNLEEFVRIVENKGFAVPTSRELDRLNVSPSHLKELRSCLKDVSTKEEITAISLSLLTLKEANERQPLEVCWTGPSRFSQTRMTWPVLSEMILSAQKSILIVGYTINTNMGKIMDDLEEKAKSGVTLTFIIDRLGEKEDFLDWVKRLPGPPQLYDRPEDSEDPMSALHVKCLVVDESVAMFGSANLTYHGTRGNIELGLVVRDKNTVVRIVRVLNELKQNLERFEQ